MSRTTRFGLRNIAGASIQPGANGIKLPDGVTWSNPDTDGSAPNTGGYDDLLRAVDGGLIQKVELTVTDLLLEIAAADDYGSAQLLDLSDSNYIIFAAETDLVATKDGTGIVDGAQPTVAIGTAAASNASLTGTMVDVLDEITLAATNPADADAHSNSNGSPGLVFLADSASNALYLNAAATLTADGSLTFAGSVNIYILDVGNISS